jgi:DNA replication initiation complex subunit (GINS family)|tara:strand:- start:666 stop:1214 length:549 start_codon:yes stop_codon:yes gene_type:complete
MISYEELYEYLRKEKFGDNLQKLPMDFMKQFADFLCENKRRISMKGDFFSEDVLKYKKEYENSLTLFNELMLRRKKKILNLVFVAAETGVMKKDFEEMLDDEQHLFERLVLAVSDTDKSINELLDSCSLEDILKEILIGEDIEQFVDMTGEAVGPFKKGDVVKLDSRVADVLIGDGKGVLKE